MDKAPLEAALESSFDGSDRARSVVARQARDLADAGLLTEDLGVELTPEFVVSNLADAPDDYSLVERWNWWLGSLDLSHGGYNRFRVRPDIEDAGDAGDAGDA
ncbi:hypothetical protein BRC83_02085 [Halobacteriales archaeon QS_1_68_17]|nr:MAG: hypothetical protein BRC83_02085 [Halobacteriales archaeon QS_1_68_17]